MAFAAQGRRGLLTIDYVSTQHTSVTIDREKGTKQFIHNLKQPNT
jgi:hypothetical protein